METDLVLGVAMAPTALGMVLVRGRHADGEVLDRDLIETTTAVDTARNAVMRTYSTAVKHGYRIRGIGVTQTGLAADAGYLVDLLRQVGVRTVVVVDPETSDSPAAIAAAHALDMVREPVPTPRTATTGGRHRHSASNTPRRVAVGAAVTGLLTVLAATVVVHATSTDPAPPEEPTIATAVPAASSTVLPAERTTPRAVITGKAPRTRSSAPATIASVTVEPSPPAEPEVTAAPETPAGPPPDPSQHMPGSDAGPRLPGPADSAE
jgi:hypothetical protein